MEKLGEFLGWATGALFLAAMLNYAVKRINKRWILPLPKESAFRQYYQKGMRILVKYHRYLGLGAALVVAVHLLVQITWEGVSVTGLTAAILLLLTAALGAVMLYGRKGKLIVLHRVAAAAGFAAALLHLLLKV